MTTLEIKQALEVAKKRGADVPDRYFNCHESNDCLQSGR